MAIEKSLIKQIDVEVYDPALRNSSPLYRGYNAGWTTITIQLSRVKDVPGKNTTPGFAKKRVVLGIKS